MWNVKISLFQVKNGAFLKQHSLFCVLSLSSLKLPSPLQYTALHKLFIGLLDVHSLHETSSLPPLHTPSTQLLDNVVSTSCTTGAMGRKHSSWQSMVTAPLNQHVTAKKIKCCMTVLFTEVFLFRSNSMQLRHNRSNRQMYCCCYPFKTPVKTPFLSLN